MTNSPHGRASSRFLTLDGMRGLAALAVVVWHTGATRFLPGGYLAVDLFFVLSGFVLANAYSDRGLNVGAFMKARLIRLYPLYALGLILGGLASWIWIRPFLPLQLNFLFNAAFLPAAAPVGDRYVPYPFNNPSWSLLFELLINAVWFPLRRYLSGRVMAGILILSAICTIGLTVAVGSLDVGSQGYGFLSQGLIRVCYSFFAGVAVYKLSRLKPSPLKLNPLLCMVVLALILATPLPRHLIDPVAVLILFPALVYVSAGVEPAERLKPLFLQLGVASYAVYCLHSPMIALVFSIFGNQAAPSAWVVATMPAVVLNHLVYVIAAVSLPSVVLLAFAADRWLDTPIRAWLTRRLGKQALKPAAR